MFNLISWNNSIYYMIMVFTNFLWLNNYYWIKLTKLYHYIKYKFSISPINISNILFTNDQIMVLEDCHLSIWYKNHYTLSLKHKNLYYLTHIYDHRLGKTKRNIPYNYLFNIHHMFNFQFFDMCCLNIWGFLNFGQWYKIILVKDISVYDL